MSLEKNVLTFVNYSLVFFGIALLIIGTILSEPSNPILILLDETFAPSFVVGLLCVFLSFSTLLTAVVGLAGSVKEIKLCVLMFLLMMVLNGVLQGVTIYFAFDDFIHMEVTVTNGLKEAMPQYAPNHTSINEEFVNTWDITQQRGECCGVDAPSDWSDSGYFLYNTYPDSCCKNMTLNCAVGELHPEIFESGCFNAVTIRTFTSLIFAGAIAFLMFVPETLGILSACHVLQIINEKGRFARI